MNMGKAAGRSASLAGLIVLVLTLAFSACASAPKPAPPPVAAAPEPAPDLAALIGSKDTPALRKFFSNRAALDTPDANGNYPLHSAVEQDAPDILELILVLGAKVDPLDKQGRTPLRLAVDEGKARDAKVLAQRGADLFAKDAGGTTVAEAAIAKGGDMLLAVFGGANLNVKGPDGKTALMIAADRLSEQGVNDLLKAGADPSIRDNSGRSALDFALLHPDRIEAGRIAETLVLRGANPSIGNWSWFAQAIRAADFTSTRFEDGKTPLHKAVEIKAGGIVQFLLSRGANPNAHDGSGSTPLHEAMRLGWVDGAAILLAGKADPNARDGFDNTPLHIALPPGSRQAGVELLLSKGADPTHKDRNGNTALHVAVQVGYSAKIIGELLAAGASANAANS
ncbi:MAG: ankyrin repeat domain-containing protein, partial [Treponema sp.]|nr:ankyrin repeat domain-containing protein [Treponema sp.]